VRLKKQTKKRMLGRRRLSFSISVFKAITHGVARERLHKRLSERLDQRVILHLVFVYKKREGAKRERERAVVAVVAVSSSPTINKR